MSSSLIPVAIIAAYKATLFNVDALPPFNLKIGSISNELLALYRQHKVSSATFITACNPYSKPLSDDVNFKRNEVLLAELEQLGHIVCEGEGCDPDGQWPSEPSYFILGMSKANAVSLGNAFQQNAIVWCNELGKVELVLLR